MNSILNGSSAANQLALTTIEQSNHQVLRQSALPIQFPLKPEVKQFIADMQDFIEHLSSPFGKPAGLAAPQVGKPWRIVFIQIPAEAKTVRKDVYDIISLTLLINPSYTPVVEEGKIKDWEACYSVTGKMGEVYRYKAINYEYYTLQGKKVSGIARGFLARLLQHEIGHLNGELYIDLLSSDSRYGDADTMMSIRKRELTTQ